MSDIHLCPTYVREIFLTLPGHTMSDILQTYAGGRKLALDVWVSRFASNLVCGLPINVHVRDLFFSCQAVSNSRKSAVVLYFYIAVIIQLLLHVCTCLRYHGMHAQRTTSRRHHVVRGHLEIFCLRARSCYRGVEHVGSRLYCSGVVYTARSC